MSGLKQAKVMAIRLTRKATTIKMVYMSQTVDENANVDSMSDIAKVGFSHMPYQMPSLFFVCRAYEAPVVFTDVYSHDHGPT